MAKIQERVSTHIYKVNKISKEEIEEMTGLCVYEEPPYCNAACPLKLDTRALMAAVAEGSFSKALQIYEKITPFPSLLSAGCDAPCESKCKLCQLGDGLSIRAIEAAAVQYGESRKGSGVFRMKKKQTVAVFGDDLFCLFLTGELEKKMYPLMVYSEAADIEEYAKKNNALPELVRLKGLDVNFRFGCDITPEFFASEQESYKVICASEEVAKRIFHDAVCNEAFMVCEGTKIVMGAGKGIMAAAFGAKKAALTVDRLAQNLSPDNMRGNEGPVETRLYTNTDAATALRRVEVIDQASAVAEAKRCIQCHCDECFKGCAFLRHYKKHPGLIAREIYNNTQIIMGTHPMNEAMNSCSLCEQCTFTCPSGIDMAKVCRNARVNMVSTDKMPLARHEFALLDMMFSNDEAFLSRKQPGFDKCRYVFFPGCQAGAVAPDTVKAAYEDLCSRLDGGVALMLGCCGVMANWAGREEIYASTREFLDQELEKLGYPTVIAGCPMCKKELMTHEGLNVIGVWDVLNQLGLPATAKSLEKAAVLHDACGARGDQETQNAIRNLVEKLGCQIEETAFSGDRTQCCGYGGLTAYANKEVAHEMTESCLALSEAPYITYCMGCRDRFAREGRETRHVLELVYGTDAGAAPDISEKRFNRLSLKQELLKNTWKEDVDGMSLDFIIEYTEEARKLMDERMILTSDVEEVLKNLRQTGEAISDTESGLLVTRSRVGNVTFWVKYEEIDGGYRVHRAYSHRMFIVMREG